MRHALLAAALLAAGALAAGAARAQPLPAPQAEAPVRDPDFRVETRQFGLERRVEMRQWQRSGRGYAAVWSDAPIASAGFPPGHANPPAWPLPGRRWLASATLDGKPVDPAALLALGEWREFRPGFTRLPPNLAASFQPEGDGLGSADDPLRPQIGDLRIRWRELVLPPVEGKLALLGGMWRLKMPAGDPPAAGGERDAPASASRSVPAWRWPWWLGAAGGVLGIGALALVRRRKR